MDEIIEEEIERWLDWFEGDGPTVEYFRKRPNYNLSSRMAVSRLRQYGRSFYRKFLANSE
jgi:hypothetical protein